MLIDSYFLGFYSFFFLLLHHPQHPRKGMERQVQQYVALRIGSLWFDVPIGPLVTLLSQSSLRSMGPSPTKQDQEKEVFSAAMEGYTYTHVLPRSAKKNTRSAEKVYPRGVVNPSAAAAPCMEEKVGKVAKSSDHMFKSTEEMAVISNGKEKLVHKLHDKQPEKEGQVSAILPYAPTSIRTPASAQTKLQRDTPSLDHVPSEGCPEAIYGHSHYPVQHQDHQRNARRIKRRRGIVGKVHIHFCKNIEHNFSDRRFYVSKGGLRIKTMVTSNPSTVVAFIRFIWKKYLNHAKHRVVGLDCEYTSYVHKKERRKLPLEKQGVLVNQEPQRAAVLQLCVGKNCLVYQLYQAHARGCIPPLLRWFLTNDTIMFVGAAIGNDIKKLEFYNLGITNAVDLQQLGIKVHNHKEGQLLSLEKLAKKVAKIKLNKDKIASVCGRCPS